MSNQSISVLQYACKPESTLHYLKCGHYVDLGHVRFPCQRNCMAASEPPPVEDGQKPALLKGQWWMLCNQCLGDEWSTTQSAEADAVFDDLWATQEYKEADVVSQQKMEQDLFERANVANQYYEWVNTQAQQGRFKCIVGTEEVDMDDFVDDVAGEFDAGTQLAESLNAQHEHVLPRQAPTATSLVPALEPLWQSKMREELSSMTLGGEKKEKQKPTPQVPGAWQLRQERDRAMEDMILDL